MKDIRKSKAVMSCVGIIVVLIFLFSGCAYFPKQDDAELGDLQDKGFAPPIYYDFGDVRIPEELKVDNKSSFVFRSADSSAGVLVLEGRVEIYSLIGFFESSMVNDKWTFVCSFKSPRTIMIFKKHNRRCVINITKRPFSTFVEVWVAPTVESDLETLIE